MGKALNLTSVALLLLLGACSDELGKKDDSKPVATFTKESVRAEVVPTTEPNKYQVVLKWDPTSEVMIVSRAGAPQIKLNSATTETSDVLDGGKTYEYRFETYKDGTSKTVQLHSLSVVVPYDYVFKGERKLEGDLVVTANRIFVNADAVITAYRHKIVLKSKELISKGGKFQNYPAGFVDCAKQQEGFAGGDITIDAEIATGSLNISLKGADASLRGGCWNGGSGGKLTVRAKHGESLLLNLALAASAGAKKEASWMADGKPGTPPTTCIALAGEETCG